MRTHTHTENYGGSNYDARTTDTTHTENQTDDERQIVDIMPQTARVSMRF